MPICHYCSEAVSRTNSWVEYETGEVRCVDCLGNRDFVRVIYPADSSRRIIERARSVYLEDVGEYAPHTWAVENAYHDLRRGRWYLESPETRAERERENLRRERESLRESRAPLGHSTNILHLCDYDADALERGALMFGVELEMEPTEGEEEAQSELVSLLGGALGDRHICKYDGSLMYGVELVSTPLTLEQHRTEFGWKEKLAPVLRQAKSGRNTTNCGMHVHINKRALSALQIGKMLVFLNSDSNAEFVTDIAQRASTQYCERSDKKITDGRYSGESRYDILNVSNANTVEVRMFRGNLRYQRVLKNLEFCHALVVYCKDASIRAVEHYTDFLAWVNKRRAEYPMLSEFLADRGYLEKKKVLERVSDL